MAGRTVSAYVSDDIAESVILEARREERSPGQIAALLVPDHLEAAREAARLVHLEVEAEPHDAVLIEDHPGRYRPDAVNPSYRTDTDEGDVEAALASSTVTVDATYRTPAEHNNPMEPHATTARWEGDRLTVFDSNQGATPVQQSLAVLFGIDEDDVEVVSPHVGGGFGSKGTPRPTVVAAAMAARVVGRPVRLGATRQQMFAFVGYRTPTIQRVRLGSTADGRLTAISHEVVEQTSRIKEFAEQTAVATRTMYAGANRRTTPRLARLDVPTPSWMRAPGECPGMFALESAMDELAAATGVAKSTMANKAALIRRTLQLGPLEPELCRRELLARHPYAWLVEIDGFIVDVRALPQPLQDDARHRGLVPTWPGSAVPR